MALTSSDIKIIKDLLNELRKEIKQDIEILYITQGVQIRKAVEEEVKKATENVMRRMDRDFPTRMEMTQGLSSFKKTISSPMID